MLHIILLILKMLGILLLGILGLILLAVIIILMSPAVYSLEASGKDSPESMKGKIKFHWLLRLISGEMCYEAGIFTWRIRAGWKRFGSDMGNSSAGNSGAFEDALAEQQEDGTRSERHEERHKRRHMEQRTEKIPDQRKKDWKEHTDRQKSNSSSQGQPEKEHANSTHSRSPEKKKASLYERLRNFWEKIKYTFQKICDNIRSLIEKKERLTDFVGNEVHKNAFFKSVREIRRLLKTMRPQKADIHIEFGFTDPAVTGYALAFISMIYPFIGGFTEILPDFERKILRGRVYVRGRIRALHAASFALRLLLDKNMRTTYRHIRKFKL